MLIAVLVLIGVGSIVGAIADELREHGPVSVKKTLANPALQAQCSAVRESWGDLKKARAGFETKLSLEPLPEPEISVPDEFEVVRYDSGPRQLRGYLSRAAGEGLKPAMVWLIGGFENGVGETPWTPAPREDDQSARAFREAGLVMFYPTLRGGEGNPGRREGLYGEVDDVVAATNYLRALKHVDAARIYLGGHSTGGTLALLVAAMRSDLYRAVFAFGPAADVGGYGEPWSTADACERELRSPVWFLSSIQLPTWIIEGTGTESNIGSLEALAASTDNPMVHVRRVEGASHFSVLAPASEVLARKIAADTGKQVQIAVTDKELKGE